ncbi:Putative uncharacterized protein [Moritella viscosa]|uniref:Uncharacterized protein n=1 Tax=Moritella viscosa TaxID=80854 RepID=A0ABY1HKQ0_9GAMM|nr:Putative uncharacterized protein [Moritella viscosa]SGZ16016.1 Putative uncharacterized protein [Moritella viscosa]SHO28711.1 Putative uncharacterized protein [Moritella viscosa]
MQLPLCGYLAVCSYLFVVCLVIRHALQSSCTGLVNIPVG